MQEPIIRDVVETCTSRPRPGQKFETSSKNRRLENRKFLDYVDIFPQILKKYCHNHKVAIFSNFWNFSYLLCLLLIYKYNREKHVDLHKFY